MSTSPRPNLSPMESGESSTQETAGGAKRVSRACDRCKMKKVKCDGLLPCSRCNAEDSLCTYAERRRVSARKIPPGYVEYLEEQQNLLVAALRRLRSQNAPSSSSPSTSQEPSIHSILEELGVLSRESQRNPSSIARFEEDLIALRRRLEEESGSASEASSVGRTTTSSPELARRSSAVSRAQDAPQLGAPPNPSRRFLPQLESSPAPQSPRFPVTAPTSPFRRMEPFGQQGMFAYEGLQFDPADFYSSQQGPFVRAASESALTAYHSTSWSPVYQQNQLMLASQDPESEFEQQLSQQEAGRQPQGQVQRQRHQSLQQPLTSLPRQAFAQESYAQQEGQDFDMPMEGAPEQTVNPNDLLFNRAFFESDQPMSEEAYARWLNEQQRRR